MITIDSKPVISPVTFKDLMALGKVQTASIGVTEKGLVVILRIGRDDSI
ncbi:partition protein, partial [Xanthomonas citri pv. citri]|nr:partition protein [Xanthomonas citri pv. citri]